MVAVVLLAFLLAEILEDVCIWMMSRSKKIRFPIATEWHGHSLSDVRYRDMNAGGYQFVFICHSITCMCFFTLLLGTPFVFGICQDIAEASWRRTLAGENYCA